MHDLLNRFPSDLSHDGALASQIFITQTQEIVDDKGCVSGTEIKKKKLNNSQTELNKLYIVTEVIPRLI